jgi:hypothetical protein
MNWPFLKDLIVFLMWLCAQLTVTEATVGFTPRRKSVLKVVFDDDTPLHGLVIRARPCTIGEWNDMLARSESETDLRGVAAANANDEFATWFMSHIEDWNLELEAGVPSPVDLNTWHALDQGWGSLIIAAWQFAMISVPKTSSESSKNGKDSEEASLGLAALSESLPNWTEPSSSLACVRSSMFYLGRVVSLTSLQISSGCLMCSRWGTGKKEKKRV